jgi:hypothetical protein
VTANSPWPSRWRLPAGEEARELRQPVAVAPRLDRGKLAPDLVRERHLELQKAALVLTPSDP